MSAQVALCHLCYRPFGRLEGTRAPYVIACGHVLCVECLSDAEQLCPICATAFDENNYRRFLALIPQPAHSPRRSGSSLVVDDDLHVASTLADAISRIDNSTAIPYIRHLHDTAYAFLQGQPRNCHKGLEANVRLLGCILQAKGTILLQSEITNELTSRVQELHSENAHLRRQLDEVKRLYDEEKECVREIQAHISDYMRTHPEIDLIMDEIIAFRSEINELRAAVAAIGGGDMSPQSTPSIPSLTDMEESEPPSATVPLMPSTPNETAMEASQLLASPLFIPALPEIGHGHEANCLDIDSDLDLERLRPDLYSKPIASPETLREGNGLQFQPLLSEDPHHIIFGGGVGDENRRRTGYVSTEGQGASALHFGSQSESPGVGTDNNTSMASSYTTPSDGTDDGRPAAEEPKERHIPVVLITTTTSPLSATRTDDLNHARSHLSRDALRVHFKHESDLVVDHDSEPHVYGESPLGEGDDDAEVEADRLMSLSTSSITLLRTPHNEVLNNSDAEDLQTRLHDLLHGVGSLAPSSSGPLDLLPPRADNLDAVPPSRLSVTGTEVSRLSDMHSVRPTRRRINTRVDTAHISQHVVDEMRKVLVEVVSRVFVQLVSDVPLPSSSSLSVPLVTEEGTHIEETPSVQLFSALNEEISRESDDGAGLHEEGGQEEKLGDGGRAT